MATDASLFTSGAVADRVQLPRWRLLYYFERGALPGPSFSVPGRRLFTEADVLRIEAALAERPGLRGGPDPTDESQLASKEM